MKSINQLHLGDNLSVLRNHVASNSVDLIYLDPPFASNADYNYISTTDDTRPSSSVVAFVDTWQWGAEAELALHETKITHQVLGNLLEVMTNGLKCNGLAAYLAMMAIRLLELKRVLKPAGSLYLHCDTSASSYLKIILDIIFGTENFRNEIVWKRTSSHNDSKKWAHIHDTILFYAGKGFTWNPVYLASDPEYVKNFYRFEDNRGRYRLHEIIRTASMGPRPNLAYEYKGYRPEWGWRMVLEKVQALDQDDRLTWSGTGRPYLKRYLHEQKGTPCSSLWTDIPPLSHIASERMGYPTQKPLALLERIIKASSNENDVVLDPFAGCGTSTHAAEKLVRRWIGIDVSELAVTLMQQRLKASFSDVAYTLNKIESTSKSVEVAIKAKRVKTQKTIVFAD